VIGECSVHFAVEQIVFDRESFQEGREDVSCHAVSAVDEDAQRFVFAIDQFAHVFHIVGENVAGFDRARSFGVREVAGVHECFNAFKAVV